MQSKAIPIQVWKGMRIPAVWGTQISRQSTLESGEVDKPGRLHPSGHISCTISVTGWVDQSELRRTMSMKNFSDTTENWTRDIPVCSVLLEPAAPPLIPFKVLLRKEIQSDVGDLLLYLDYETHQVAKRWESG